MDLPSVTPVATFLIACFGCRQPFDAFEAAWCGRLVSKAIAHLPSLPELRLQGASGVAAYRDMGVIEVIPKPFEPMTLATVIRAIYERAN